MRPESFEHEQNIPVSHKNVPEYLKSAQNAVRILKTQFDYQRIYNEFLFRWQGLAVLQYPTITLCSF